MIQNERKRKRGQICRYYVLVRKMYNCIKPHGEIVSIWRQLSGEVIESFHTGNIIVVKAIVRRKYRILGSFPPMLDN